VKTFSFFVFGPALTLTIVLALTPETTIAGDEPTLETLQAADYMKGKRGFQSRCSACHTLADSSGDIAGPNLWGVFARVAGTKPGFTYSDALRATDFQWSPSRLDAWLADPKGYLPGNIMGIPEAVPESERLNILSFMMIETGAVDWPRPETNFSDAQADASKHPSERFPSFWNHLMFNTAHYRWENEQAGEDFPFDAWFKTDGTVAAGHAGRRRPYGRMFPGGCDGDPQICRRTMGIETATRRQSARRHDCRTAGLGLR